MSIDVGRILTTMTLNDLKELCRKNNLKGFSNKNRANLVKMILESLTENNLVNILKDMAIIPEDILTYEEIEKKMNKRRKIDDALYLKYLLTSLNKKDLNQICKQFFLEGCSKYNKSDLLMNIIDSLSEEERKRLIYEHEMPIVKDGIETAINKITGNDDRERLTNIKILVEEEHELEAYFSGFNWETVSYLAIRPENIDNPERTCDCRIGAAEGFCNHFWVGVIFSIRNGWLNLNDWTLTLLPEDFKVKIESVQINGEKGTLVDTGSSEFSLKKFENTSITIYKGTVENIEEKEDEYEGVVTTWYLVTLKDIKLGPRVQRKSDFNENLVENVEKLYIRVSQNVRDTSNLKIGDETEINGKLSYDNFHRQYIVKNIRKITKN